MMKSRRQFLQLTTASLAVSGLAPFISASATPLAIATPAALPPPFTLSMAGYSFKEFTVEQTIAMMNRLDVHAISLKDFHLPLNSTQEEADTVIAKFRTGGIEVYAAGVIYMKSRDEVDNAFEYIKRMHCNLIVGAPDYELLPYLEQKVKETGIRVAIHNHGPDNPLYPNATDVWNHIRDLDSRIGICLDIGHTTRDGHDPAGDMDRYFARIFDMHIKDVTKAAKDGTTCEMGRGVIDIPGFVKTLLNKGYTGHCSLEFEKDMKDPLPGMAESLGYFKGVVNAQPKL